MRHLNFASVTIYTTKVSDISIFCWHGCILLRNIAETPADHKTKDGTSECKGSYDVESFSFRICPLDTMIHWHLPDKLGAASLLGQRKLFC